MTTSRAAGLPRFVVFEGVDGCGKTTLARAVAHYYDVVAPGSRLYTGAFPGVEPGTLGDLVYRLHHGTLDGAPQPKAIAPPALQLLHVAAHVDAILTRIAPAIASGGAVILDRYWWSTYAYARRDLSPERVWPLIAAERPFWDDLPDPVVIYLTRRASLKGDEIDPATHATLDAAYREVLAAERAAGIRVHELANDGALADTWTALLAALSLPLRPLEEAP